MKRGRLAQLGLPLWATALLACGLTRIYTTIFSRLMPYDDEGTMLFAVREFERGGRLYEDVYSAYGPFYFLVRHLYHGVLQAPVTHDANRLLSTALWFSAALGVALFARRLTHSVVLASIVYLQLLLHASVLSYEPGHPQGICLVILMAIPLVATYIDEGRPQLLPFALLGALLGAIALTKVNLGVFLAISLAMSLAAFTAAGPLRTAVTAASALAGLATPFLLMRQHLDEPWVGHYALVVATAWAGVAALVQRAGSPRRLSARHWIALGAGALVVASAAIALVVSHGTAVASLVDAVAIAPLRFPGQFLMPRTLQGLGEAFALRASCAIAFAAALLFAFGKTRSRAAMVTLGIAKIAFAEVVIMLANWSQSALLAYGLPWLWLVVPTGDGQRRTTAPRVVLASLAALQALQAYPIAGSQLAWSTVLLLPAAALCAYDAWILLGAEAWETTAAPTRQRAVAALFAAIAVFYWVRLDLPHRIDVWKEGTPLALPGASRIRTTRARAEFFQWWTANLRANCDAFVAIPGYASLYFWTEIPPLNGLYAGGWAQRFGDGEQQRMLAVARQSKRFCILRKTKRGIYALPHGGAGPLLQYIDTLVPGAERAGHVLLVPPTRTGLSTALAFGRAFRAGVHDFHVLPADLLPTVGDFALAGWLRTKSGGVLIGSQSQALCQPFTRRRQAPDEKWSPLLYVGTAGRVHGQFGGDPGRAIISADTVTDGAWHHIVLQRRGGRDALYLDGTLAGDHDAAASVSEPCLQLGVGYTEGWADTNDDWFEFDGEVASLEISAPLDDAEILSTVARGPALFAPREAASGDRE